MKFATIVAAAGVAAFFGAEKAWAQDAGIDLAGASPEEGERLFRQCKACHTVDKGGRNRAGPNLYGVVGRPVASVDGFRYSAALSAYGGEWTPDRLDAYLANPRAEVPGTRMSFRGLKDPSDRASVIAFLNANSDTPLDLAVTGDGEETGEAAEEPEFGLLVVAEGVEDTYYVCTGCHSEMIVAQQGKTRAGWDELLDWMIEEQGMPELDESERDVILDYLAEHYNTDRPNFPRR